MDCSPRYDAIGAWTQTGGLSTLRSDICPRPLPCREFSVRNKKYNALVGTHEITLSPNGWTHVQNNRKFQLDPDGTRRYLRTEIGFSRYEEITAPVLSARSSTAGSRDEKY